jgi:hypothetical protein
MMKSRKLLKALKFMADDIRRWKNNGLPRKGWLLVDVIDEEFSHNQCDWCGTVIRYVHYLKHPIELLQTQCGCICAEHLTEDYVSSKLREKELRKISAKRIRDLKREKQKEKLKYVHFFREPRKTKKGNYWIKYDDILVLIFSSNDFWKLKIGNKWGRQLYETVYQAQSAAWDYLTSKEPYSPKW